MSYRWDRVNTPERDTPAGVRWPHSPPRRVSRRLPVAVAAAATPSRAFAAGRFY